MESRRKRVEQKGRFTITEIIPGSPYSPRVSSPSFQEDEVAVADLSVDAPTSSSSSSEVASIQPQPAPPQQLLAVEIQEVEKIAATAVEEPARKAEEPPETHTQPPETVSAPIEAKLLDMEASTMECTGEVATPTIAVASPPRKYSSPKKTRGARRVKRKGRFTIIELASDSPTSTKNTDDLYDHRFVTTTSIGGTSVESSPQLGNQLSLNFDNVERRARPKRATRSMPRLRQPSSMRRRRRSESPSREFIEAVDMGDPIGNQQQQEEATAYAKLQALPTIESMDPLARVDVTTTIIAAAGTAAIGTSANGAVSVTSVVIPDSDLTTVAVSPTSVRPVTPSSQLLKLPENNGGIVNAPQPSITVSTAQYMQQQQTIASLIRQQHDLKQIISVLQEQQRQLMAIPSQINELKRQRGLSNGESRDEELRELYMQVDKLTQANESLHSLINASEREARHRTLEIECLSEENDELRHRFVKLESRYMDERKQSFALEEELQRLRMLSLTQQEHQLRQQQQQSQKLGNSQPGAAAV